MAAVHLPTYVGESVVEAAEQVVATSTAHVVDGTLLDLFTAGVITQVAGVLSPVNRARLDAMDATTAGSVCLRLIARRAS